MVSQKLTNEAVDEG